MAAVMADTYGIIDIATILVGSVKLSLHVESHLLLPLSHSFARLHNVCILGKGGMGQRKVTLNCLQQSMESMKNWMQLGKLVIALWRENISSVSARLSTQSRSK